MKTLLSETRASSLQFDALGAEGEHYDGGVTEALHIYMCVCRYIYVYT